MLVGQDSNSYEIIRDFFGNNAIHSSRQHFQLGEPGLDGGWLGNAPGAAGRGALRLPRPASAENFHLAPWFFALSSQE